MNQSGRPPGLLEDEEKITEDDDDGPGGMCLRR